MVSVFPFDRTLKPLVENATEDSDRVQQLVALKGVEMLKILRRLPNSKP